MLFRSLLGRGSPRLTTGVRQETSPHVDGVATEDWPLDDVHPAQSVAAERSGNLNNEGGKADCLGEGEPRVNSPDFALIWLIHSITINAHETSKWRTIRNGSRVTCVEGGSDV